MYLSRKFTPTSMIHGALSILTKNPVCGSGMFNGKMERYSVTGLVNNGRLVGRFPFDGNSGNLA
jgi:hypothetical protein